MNEIVWAYDYGARSKSKWPAKHDTPFWYAQDRENYQFHVKQCDRIPYMAPSLVGPEEAAQGKTPTDTWWHTIVIPNGKERTGYPTQEPIGVIDRIVKAQPQCSDGQLTGVCMAWSRIAMRPGQRRRQRYAHCGRD
jgi:site-specific DNA-methyltransferase (adenine-specific)